MTTTPAAPPGRRETIADLATAYAGSRDPADLQRLRRAVRRSRTYRPDLDVARLVAPLQQRDPAATVEAIRALMPGAFFSPTAHAVLAAAHDRQGDHTRADRERRTARLAMASILTSGDGSRDRPWHVLRVSDQYDVLRAQGRASRTQRKVVHDGRSLDHHVCDDGSEAWFGIDLLDRREQ